MNPTNNIWNAQNSAAYGQLNQAANHLQGYAAAQSAPPPVPTRLSILASRLEGQVSQVLDLVNRANRVADRLGGAVPQPVADATPKRDGSCLVAILEAAQNDLETQLIRLGGIVERLEGL